MPNLLADYRYRPTDVGRELNLLVRYYDLITSAPVADTPLAEPGDFEPVFAFPRLDDTVRDFLAPATAAYQMLDEVDGVKLRLLDLRRNPATQTTKTFPSLLLVARAVEHIRRNREPILIFSPSSGNKAVALRDAVHRALSLGLVEPTELRIVTLTPEMTSDKLRRSPLSDDPDLRRLNPALVLPGPHAEAVKEIGASFVRAYRQGGQDSGRLWATLRLANYRQADMARAFADHEIGAAGEPGPRLLHAHAVSSAYGLLGYQTGLDRLRARGVEVNQPGFLLVQHLATCDMVLHTLTGGFLRAGIPCYRQCDGYWAQDTSPNFPRQTWAPDEILEQTFYTHTPTTATEMSGLIAAHGGTGIVVSRLECVRRYAQCRHLLRDTGIALPDDPRQLREWSLVMALTGVLNAIERGLVTGVDGIVVHASGSYGRDDYEAIPPEHLGRVEEAAGVLAQVAPTRRRSQW